MPATDTPETLAAAGTAMLERLIAIDTTSRLSNLTLIELVEAELGGLGIASRRVVSPATAGPIVA